MKKQSSLTLVDPDIADLHRQFDELIKKTNKNDPKDSDVQAFRKLLADNPKARLWERIAGVMMYAETFTLEAASPLPASINEVFRRKQADIRKRLGYDEASEMEQLLITHAALCWLRLGIAELQYTKITSRENSLRLCEFYERSLGLAQKRFTRACETLAKVRRLGVMTGRQEQPTQAAKTA